MAPRTRKTLRLTPVPHNSVSPSPLSPIPTISNAIPNRHSRSVTFSTLPDLVYTAPSSSNDPSSKAPSLSSNSVSDTPLASPSSSPSALSEWSDTPTPEIRTDTPQLEAARQAAGILKAWCRDDMEEELKGWKRIGSADEGSIEKEVGPMKFWVRECLRHRHRVYIQTFSDLLDEHRVLRGTKNATDLGSECEYPGCGRAWVYGDYRVSFEPLGWSQPVKTAHSRSVVDLTGEGEAKHETEEEENGPVIAIPDYHRMTNPRNVAEHGNGAFYCVRCFENLLEIQDEKAALGAVHKGKRKKVSQEKWIRPNPLCRIYASVFAEDRVHPGGGFVLDCEASDIVRRWKDAVMEERTREMVGKFGSFFKESDIEEEKEEDEFKVQVDGGRGLAECFAGMKVGEIRTPTKMKRRKR